MVLHDARVERRSVMTLRTTNSPDLPSLLEKQLHLIMTQQRQRRRVFDSWILFLAIAITAFAAVGASTAVTIIDALRLELTVASWSGISIAASITGGLALISIVSLAICRIGYSGSWFHGWLLPAIGASIALAAAVLALGVLIMITMNQDDVAQTQKDILNIIVQYVLWAVAALTELLFYGFLGFRRHPAADNAGMETPSVSTFETKQAPRRPPSPPSPLRMIAPPYALPQASTPICTSPLRPESARSSWRDSLSSFRPANSKTKLVGSRSSLSRDSSVRSIHTAQSDAFDFWDTSTVDSHLREAIMPGVPSKGRQLEPIPGSRPSSPGTALNGPFPVSDEAPSRFYPERPPTSQSTISQTTTRGTTKRTFIPTSRPSDVGDESHIHPLFRSDSPTPPPGVSSNTIVMASPMGGQTVPTPLLPSRPGSRMRSASQVSNRAPSRAGPRAPSRAASFDSLRRTNHQDDLRPSFTFPRTTSPLSTLQANTASSSPPHPSNTHLETSSPLAMLQHDLKTSSDASRSASPSPISRKMTPPIPEFILSIQREGVPRMKGSKETLRSRANSGAPLPGTAI